MKSLMRASALTFALALAAGPVLAAPGGHAGAPTHQPAGHTPEAQHGQGAHEAASHGAHHSYTADTDGDGTPNWADPMNGDEPNETYVIKALGFHAFNLVLLVGLLFYFVRQPLADVLRERARLIKHELTESAAAREEITARHKEVLHYLSQMDTEMERLKEHAHEEAKVEEAKLIERAHLEAARIQDTTQRTIRDEVARARNELRKEVVGLAVELAEGILAENVNQADQQGLAREFLQSIKDQPRA